MNKNSQITVTVLEEAGYDSAMLGLSYNKDQPIKNMPTLAKKLCQHDGGHNKFLEQIMLWLEVRAPRYWWQEADTYRLSSKSSQSTMHTILNNELRPEQFECGRVELRYMSFLNELLIKGELIELKRFLPEGFMQKRMWMMSYKTLRNIILQRKNHRLPHWPRWIESIVEQIKHPELLPIIS